MPILLFLVLVILIAQIGFWDTLEAILGGIAMIVLLLLLAGGVLALAISMAMRRAKRGR